MTKRKKKALPGKVSGSVTDLLQPIKRLPSTTSKKTFSNGVWLVGRKEHFRGKKVSYQDKYCLVCEREFDSESAVRAHVRTSPKHRISWKRFLSEGRRLGQLQLQNGLDLHNSANFPIHPLLDKRQAVYPPGCGYCVWCGAVLTGRQRLYCSAACREDYHVFHHPTLIKRRAVLKQNYTCAMCGLRFFEDAFQLDHIKAIVLGGDIWDPENHQALCKECHKVKTRRDLFERKHGFRYPLLKKHFSSNGKQAQVFQQLSYSHEEVDP